MGRSSCEEGTLRNGLSVLLVGCEEARTEQARGVLREVG